MGNLDIYKKDKNVLKFMKKYRYQYHITMLPDLAELVRNAYLEGYQNGVGQLPDTPSSRREMADNCGAQDTLGCVCGMCERPSEPKEDSWDDLDHLLAICNCLPPHSYLYNAKDQKAVINADTTNKIIEELEAVQFARSLMSDLPNRDRVTEEELAKRIKAFNHRKDGSINYDNPN